MTLRVEPSGVGCGALLRGVDLSQPQSPAEIDAIRHAWLDHLVIGICDQNLEIADRAISAFCGELRLANDAPTALRLTKHWRTPMPKQIDRWLTVPTVQYGGLALLGD